MAKTDKEDKNVSNKHFWKDFKAELKKVIWPTPKQIVNNTATVIGIVIITVVIVFILDVAFDALNTYGINKLRTAVSNTIETTEDEKLDANLENNTESTDGENLVEETNSDNENVEISTENNSEENNIQE